MLPRILSRVVGWAKAHHFYDLEFKERGESLWAFMRTWEKDTFRRVAVDVVDRFTVDATQDVAVLGSVVAAGAEHRNWMMSRTSLRRAIITGELSMPSLVEVVSNIVGVWPLIVVYLKETGRKTDGDSLVV